MFAPDVLEPTVSRLVELAGGGRALEFAIGTGRVGVPLAGRGVPVTGIELSQAMVAQLRQKADETAIPVVVGDMATTRVSGEFALVYLVYNTIGNLLTQAEQVQCFRNAAAPGYIGVDTYDVVHQLLTSNHFTFGEGRAAHVGRSPHRYIWPAELDRMGLLAGFELESRHADWAEAELTADSRSHVSVYRLRGLRR